MKHNYFQAYPTNQIHNIMLIQDKLTGREYVINLHQIRYIDYLKNDDGEFLTIYFDRTPFVFNNEQINVKAIYDHLTREIQSLKY